MPDPIAAGTAASGPTRPRRRSRRYVLGVALVVTAVSLVLDPFGWRDVPWHQSSYTTPVGQSERVSLPDDSLLVVGDNSAAKVAYYASRRSVTLDQGWVGVQVDGRTNVPFVVSLGSVGQVRATDARFGVRHLDDGFSVAVREGSAEIRTGPWWNRHVTHLYAGGIASIGADESVTVRRHDEDPLQGR